MTFMAKDQLEGQEQQFYSNIIHALKKRWNRCISVAEDYNLC